MASKIATKNYLDYVVAKIVNDVVIKLVMADFVTDVEKHVFVKSGYGLDCILLEPLCFKPIDSFTIDENVVNSKLGMVLISL